jgi:hypothetical protein
VRNIFDLTRREQRLIIAIVAALVAIAFAKHLFENKLEPPPARSTSVPTTSPAIHDEEERPEPDDSR